MIVEMLIEAEDDIGSPIIPSSVDWWDTLFDMDTLMYESVLALPHKAESGVDTGWILRQRSVSAHGNHGSSTVHVRCMYG